MGKQSKQPWLLSYVLVLGLFAINLAAVSSQADSAGNRIGVISTVAGNGESELGKGSDGTQASTTGFPSPRDMAADATGNLYVHDTGMIRRVDTDGTVTTVLGGAGNVRLRDIGPSGVALEKVNVDHLLSGVAVDRLGNVFFSCLCSRVFKLEASSGLVKLIAGTPYSGFSGDGGPAVNASFYFIQAILLDPLGHLYIADTINNRIRRVDPLGTVITVAGGGAPADNLGDGLSANQASLRSPRDIAMDQSGRLLIADTGNHRVRRVEADGTIRTIAGNGAFTTGVTKVGGVATATAINPVSVAVLSSGHVLILSSYTRVVALYPDGTLGAYGGTGASGFSGDGSTAVSAKLNLALEVRTDTHGRSYIVDMRNRRVRMIDVSQMGPSAAPPATITEPTSPAPSDRDAVIIVPGLLGTWPDVEFQRMQKASWLAGHAQQYDFGQFLPASDALDQSSWWEHSSIQNWLERLGRAGYVMGQTLFVYHCFSLRPISECAGGLDQLVELARKRSGRSKVDLAAHSYGGLVARSYVSSGTSRGKVDQLITFGTPHHGVPAAYLGWEGGDIGQFGGFFSSLVLKDYIKSYQGSDSNLAIFRFMAVRGQSVHDLLPSYDYLTDQGQSQPRTGVCSGGNYPTGNFICGLYSPVALGGLQGIRVYSIYGVLLRADGSPDPYSTSLGYTVSTRDTAPLWSHGDPHDFWTGGIRTFKTAGDGLVPASSARYGIETRSGVDCALSLSHGNLFDKTGTYLAYLLTANKLECAPSYMAIG